MDESRKAFEEWVALCGYSLFPWRGPKMRKDDYDSEDTQSAWEAWQAGADWFERSVIEPAPKLVKRHPPAKWPDDLRP